MPNEETVRNWERQKRSLWRKEEVTLVLLVAVLLLRFVPLLNDLLSGPAQPVWALTRVMARITAQQTGGNFPVLVIREEEDPCLNIKTVKAEEMPGALYFVWTYSERQHLSCFTSYEVPADGFNGREKYTVTIDPWRAENFGREMRAAVQVVPFDRSLRKHGEEYLHLLDWRTEIHLPLAHNVIAGQTFHDPKPPSEQTNMVEIHFAELREDVARRHQRVNLFLWSAMGLLLAVTIKTGFDFRRLYCDFVQALPAGDHKLTYIQFLRRDMDARLREEQNRQREEQEQVQEEQQARRERDRMAACLV